MRQRGSGGLCALVERLPALLHKLKMREQAVLVVGGRLYQSMVLKQSPERRLDLLPHLL